MNIRQNEPLKDKNWFKTGGNAKYFCEPTNNIEFVSALKFAKEQNEEIFVLGNGANILISDDGFNGLVIRPKIKSINTIQSDQEHILLEVGSGVKFQDLIDFCLENNLIGLEEFSGIPGVVGGAVFMNIHYFEHLLGTYITSATIIEKETCKIEAVNNGWFNFDYNSTTLHEKKHYLLSATFKLKKASDLETAYAKGRSNEIIRHRNKRYPTLNTCGSFFRNFIQQEVENELSGKKVIFIAYYLDKLGFKGTLTVGDASVSHQHANMIINNGNATSSDIINIAKIMQKSVYENFGILPQAECQFIGFANKPI